MIDATSAEPVLIEEQRRGVAMVIAVDRMMSGLTARPDTKGKTAGQVTKATKKVGE